MSLLELSFSSSPSPMANARWERDNAPPVHASFPLYLDMEKLKTFSEPDDYGRFLGHAVFAGEVGELWSRLRAVTANRDEGGINVALNIPEDDLAGLHWSWLHAPFDGGWDYLGLNRNARFCLYPASRSDKMCPRLAKDTLKALIVVASPPEDNPFQMHSFDVGNCVTNLRRALGDTPCDVLAPKDSVTDALGMPTLAELEHTLARGNYGILHLVAHGRVISHNRSALYLLNEQGGVAPLHADRFVKLMDRCERPPQLVFLASCFSASPDARIGDYCGNLAWSLTARVGIPTAVAMTEAVTVDTAEALAAHFYEGLLRHGLVERALAEARTGVKQAQDMMVPVIYSRLRGRPLIRIDDDIHADEALIRDLGIFKASAALERRGKRRFAFLGLLLLVSLLMTSYGLMSDKAEHQFLQAQAANDMGQWQQARRHGQAGEKWASRIGNRVLQARAGAQIYRAEIRLPTSERLFRHPGPIDDHAWIPASQGLITVSGGRIFLWQAGHEKAIRQWSLQEGLVTALAVSGNGAYLAAAGREQIVLWDLDHEDPVRIWPDLRGPIRHLALNGSGTALAAADERGNLITWRAPGVIQDFFPLRTKGLAWDEQGLLRVAAAGRDLLVHRPEQSLVVLKRAATHNLGAVCQNGALLAWAEAKQLMVSSPPGATPLSWELPCGVRRLLPASSGSRLVAELDDGGLLVLGPGLERPYMWRPKTRERLREYALNEDGSLLATSGPDGPVQIWGRLDGTPLLSLPQSRDLKVLGFRERGSVLTVDADDEVRAWDLGWAGRSNGFAAVGEDWLVRDLSADGNHLLLTGAGIARVWVRAAGGFVGRASTGQAPISAGALTATGDLAAIYDAWGTVRLWHTDSKQTHALEPFNTGKPDQRPKLLAFNAGADSLLVVGSFEVTVFDTKSKRLVHSMSISEKIEAAAFAQESGVFWLLDINGRLLRGSIMERALQALPVTPSRGFLLQTTAAGERWLRVSTGAPAQWFDANGRLLPGPQESLHNPVTAALANNAFAVANQNNEATEILLWNGQQNRSTLISGFPEAVSQLCFSSQGTLLAIAGAGGSVWICDVVLGVEVVIISGNGPRLSRLAFSPSGDSLLTVGEDGVITVHRINRKEFP